MGIHKREREIEELKEHYVKKTSCMMMVFGALLVGAFIGNAITMVYVGQQATPQGGGPVVQQNAPKPGGDARKLAQLESNAQNNPTNADEWIKLGNYCFDHKMPQKAANAYERAVELAPRREHVWSDLGVMYRQLGQYNKALEAFGNAAKLDPEHKTSWFNMGIVYLYDLNDEVNAVRVWKKVLAIDPDAKTPNGDSVAELVKGLQK